jgi:integrase
MPALTAAAVRKLAPQARRREIRDSMAPGLYLVIQPRPSGARSWALRFRRNGKPAKLTLGDVDLGDSETADEPTLGGALTLRQARQLANEIDRKRARGIDVIEEHKASKRRKRAAAEARAANSFGAALREFFADHKTKHHARPRHWREDARLLGLLWSPDCDPAKTEPEVMPRSLAERWAERDVREIDGHDVHTVVDEARRHGVPGLPRRNYGTSESRGRKMHAALSSLFAWALRQRRVATNPCAGVWRPSAPPARDRALSDAEIALLWRASDRLAPQFGAAVKLLLLTGARLSEVCGMRRDELGEDGATWIIPAERAKNHRKHLVHLTPLAREVITAVPRVESAPGYVFTGNGKTPISGWSKAKGQLDAAMLQVAHEEAAAAGREPAKVALAPFRLHDLRRTCASGMQRLGVRLEIIELCLNHTSGSFGGIVAVYQRAELLDERRTASERWSEHVRGLASGEAAKVVTMPERKKRSN